MDQVETKRELKHIAIDNALDELNLTRQIAIQLLNRIKEYEPDNAEKMQEDTIKNRPSLFQILDESPEKIHKQCASINQVLEEINEVLF